MRRVIPFRGVWLGVLTVALSAMVLAPGALAVTTVTIGQTSAVADSHCSGDRSLVQTAVSAGASYTVPSGNWNITSWSTYAYGGSMGLLVVRPTATPGTYTVVGESQLQTLGAASALQTFSLNTITDPPIAVQGGDLLGFWATRGTQGCALISAPGDTYVYGDARAPRPSVGTVISTNSGTERLLNISATLTPALLTPALPTTKDDCKNGGWQSFGVFKNQGDCVSFIATGGKNSPANG